MVREEEGGGGEGRAVEMGEQREGEWELNVYFKEDVGAISFSVKYFVPAPARMILIWFLRARENWTRTGLAHLALSLIKFSNNNHDDHKVKP